MAEIGDVCRFYSKKALVAFAGIGAPPYQSGQTDVYSRSISKRESASLRGMLFLMMSVILQCAPMDKPGYQFINKKRSEGEPYRVYTMASANKFLRISCASVKDCLYSLKHDDLHVYTVWLATILILKSRSVCPFSLFVILKILLDFY